MPLAFGYPQKYLLSSHDLEEKRISLAESDNDFPPFSALSMATFYVVSVEWSRKL